MPTRRRQLMQQRRSPLTMGSASWSKWPLSANYVVEETTQTGRWSVAEQVLEQGFHLGGYYSSSELQLSEQDTEELVAMACSLVWRATHLRERSWWFVPNHELPRLREKELAGAEWSRVWRVTSPEETYKELRALTVERKAWETLVNLSMLADGRVSLGFAARRYGDDVRLKDLDDESSQNDGVIYGATDAQSIEILEMLIGEGLVSVEHKGICSCIVCLTDDGWGAIDAGRSTTLFQKYQSVRELALDVERSNHHPVPNFDFVAKTNMGMATLLRHRWLEADSCHRCGAYFAATVLMGSILEGVLLARVLIEPTSKWNLENAPKGDKGAVRPIDEWGLGNLIAVAVEQGWLKPSRSHFGHALKESRNVVHPWTHLKSKLEFDERTCRTCWEIVQGAIEDVRLSISNPESAGVVLLGKE